MSDTYKSPTPYKYRIHLDLCQEEVDLLYSVMAKHTFGKLSGPRGFFDYLYYKLRPHSSKKIRNTKCLSGCITCPDSWLALYDSKTPNDHPS